MSYSSNIGMHLLYFEYFFTLLICLICYFFILFSISFKSECVNNVWLWPTLPTTALHRSTLFSRMKHTFHWPAGILVETARRCGEAAFLWTIHSGDFTKLPPRLDYFELVRRPFCGFWIERLSNADGNSRPNRIHDCVERF